MPQLSSPILLLTRNDQVRARLSDVLQGQAPLIVSQLPSELLQHIHENKAAGLVLEFAEVHGGGHAEAQLLEDLRIDHPNTPIVLLTKVPCPEPLERVIACHRVDLFSMQQDWKGLPEKLFGNPNVADHIPPKPVDEASSVRGFRIPAPSRRTFGDSSGAIKQSSATSMNLSAGSNPTAAEKPNLPSSTMPFSVDRDPPPVGTLRGSTRKYETRSVPMARTLAELEVAARHNVTILLIGETGSGKTFLSRLIHEVSPRRNEPFLTVACGALPAELIESELFGHTKGSFTSAHADKEGKFVAAGGGTVLLDEIDVLGPEQQVKLLRVIETGEFEPVGSNQTLRSRARLVVASNLDLEPLVEKGRFRPDLYYRLNMLKFEILPLRKRPQDIVTLARAFIAAQSEKHGVVIRQIDSDLFEALARYPWPGNVRELEYVIQRAVIYCTDGTLSARQLPAHILALEAGPTNDPTVSLSSGFGDSRSDQASLDRQISLTEREIIEQALFKNNFSRTNTARSLGISRVTLYNKMKKYGMNR